MAEERILTIGGKPQQFVLAIDPECGLPAWATVIDEFWLCIVSSLLLKAIKDHPIICINSNTKDDKDFAASMTIDNFKSMTLTGEAARFQEYVFALLDTLVSASKSKPPLMYLSFFSETTPNHINAMLELNKGIINFGACMNGGRSIIV